jgi:ankyrin repeat protein
LTTGVELSSVEKLNDALLAAIEAGNLSKVKACINHGANIECRSDEQYTPLSLAIRNEHLPIIKYLVSKQADVNAKDVPYSATILIEAVGVNKPEILRFLLGTDANIDATGYSNRTCLHECCLISYMEMIKMVMEKHPDVNARDDEGMTPIHLSVQRDALRGKHTGICTRELIGNARNE